MIPLQVEALTTSILSGGSWRDAVRDVTFDVRARETLALVGESGCGKSLTALSIMGLLPQPARVSHGRVFVDGVDMTAADEVTRQSLRGDRIGMIFQEPMTSLNPVLPIGLQIAEPLIHHRGLKRRAALDRARELLELVRRARRGRAASCLSASILRRHAAAGDDRHRARLRSEGAHRR